MAERIDDVLERVATVENKMDSLAATMDRRFDEVAEALVEQRRYTDFAFERLDSRMSQLDGKLTRVDERVTRVDERVTGVDEKLSTLETRVNSGFARIERKLDQLIDRI